MNMRQWMKIRYLKLFKKFVQSVIGVQVSNTQLQFDFFMKLQEDLKT